MKNRPLILITNDDGIHSPGLRAAAEAVADLGDLLIVAPSRQQTGASRSYPYWPDKLITTTNLLLNEQPYPAFTADVSPAQAVTLGVMSLANNRPVSLCISGINYGENIGSGVTISGTVGAAIEAASYHIPAVAVSLETPHEHHTSNSHTIDFGVAAHFTRQFAQKALRDGLPAGVDLLKIDVPDSATVETPWQLTTISRQRYYHSLPGAFNPHTGSIDDFTYRVQVDQRALEPTSDVYVFMVQRQVAVAPMSIDMTAPVPLTEVSKFLNGAA